MRTFDARWILSLTLVGCVLGCVQRQMEVKTTDTGAVTAAVDSLSRAFGAAVAARDTNAVIDFYTDDARVLPPNAPLAEGKEAIGNVWKGFLSTPGLDLRLKTQQVVVADAGDMAVEIGSYQMTFQDAKGQPMEDTGKYVTVFKKMDGRWKIVIDTWNTDKPMPEMGT